MVGWYTAIRMPPSITASIHQPPPGADERLALRGDLLDFIAAPAWGAVDSAAVRWRPDHWLLVEGGRVVGAQLEAPGEGWTRHDHTGRLILPGFVDTHVHSPQIDVIASYGTELLDWLDTHTFPAETRHGDVDHATVAASHFLDALLAHGTTSAVVFPTVHAHSVDALFAAAEAHGMRLISGKVLMDRNAPDGLRDDVVTAEREMEALIAKWHGRARLAYAVTVRFAPTSTPEQLALAGRLCRADPSLYMQTHLAENRAEVRWVHELFPEARSYLDVYAGVGLLHAKSVFAHGIWLDDADRDAIAERRRADRALAVVEPLPRQRPLRLARRGGGGCEREPGERRRRWHEPVDAAQHGRRLQDPGARRRAPHRVEGAARGDARRGGRARPRRRDRLARAGPHRRRLRLGRSGRPGRDAPRLGGPHIA